MPAGVNGFQTVRGGGTTEGKMATQEELNYPSGVAVGPHGNIYIADTFNNRIRMVSAATGIVNTITGELNHPLGIAIDAAQKLALELGQPRGALGKQKPAALKLDHFRFKPDALALAGLKQEQLAAKT